MIRNSDKISIHMFSDIILIPTVKDYWIGVNVLIIASMDIFRKKVVHSTLYEFLQPSMSTHQTNLEQATMYHKIIPSFARPLKSPSGSTAHKPSGLFLQHLHAKQ